MICEICHKDYKNNGFPIHLKTHEISSKDYYDTYIEPNTEHKCVCGKDTPFMNITTGYRKYCCQNCARRDVLKLTRVKYGVANISQVPYVKSKMKIGIKNNWDSLSDEEYENRCEHISNGTKVHMVDAMEKLNKEKLLYAENNNLISLSDAINIYGSGFYQSKEFDSMEIVIYKNTYFIKKEDLKYFEQYNKLSKLERTKLTNLQTYGCENPMQNAEIQDKTKQTNLRTYGAENVFSSEYGKSKSATTKFEKYGNSSYNNREKAKETMLTRYGNTSYTCTRDYKNTITQHRKDLYEETGAMSKSEALIVEQIKPYVDEIIQNRKILDDFYLDIYLPKLNLAIEYNGNYWHSIEARKPIDYHLQKSLACREKGIRLIHIYEFEDFNEQISLLIELIQGADNYPINDFNKNNLITNIPEPELIYDKKYHIYGAGKLYRS